MAAPLLSDVILTTSNPQKIHEYQRFSGSKLRMEPGKDLDEVDGTPDEIIIHKALAAGPGRMVEDAIIVVDGQPMTDIRWRLDELLSGGVPANTPVIWEVRLGILHEGVVYAYLGQTHGTVVPFDVPGFGIDPIFHVTDAGATFAKLDQEDRKDPWSARQFAMDSMLKQTPYLAVDASSIEPWTGAMQNQG